ncbi:MAG: type II secretion system protein, partial [Candidatus Poribacteria bacterium]|nr:type II secretion system protein [Candidatus Poribacteria bacterium]
MNNFRSERGFTLIEMLVVMGIISLLVTISTPSMKAFS